MLMNIVTTLQVPSMRYHVLLVNLIVVITLMDLVVVLNTPGCVMERVIVLTMLMKNCAVCIISHYL